MLENGIITPRTSPRLSPIVLVKKKNGEVGFCVDYRKPNQITINDSHPLPLIPDLLDSIKDAKYFTSRSHWVGIKSGSGIPELRKRKKGKNAEKGIKRGKRDKTRKRG